MNRSRHAFTIVEIIVVIAILAVLVALLFPAVQKVREAANATQCQNNLGQLALGCLSHESTHKFLPHGGWGFQCVGLPDKKFGAKQPGGWMYSVLPYIEKSAVYYSSPNDLVKTPIELFHCPTRRAAKPFAAGPVAWQPFWTSNPLTVVARNDYAMNGGTQNFDYGGSSNKDVPPPVYHGDGVAHRALVQEVKDIIDGVSNTYLIGEKYINPDFYETSDDLGNNENCYIGSDRDTLRFADQPWQDRKGVDLSYSFGSAHRGGFFMAYCDGHVHRVFYDISLSIHRARCIRNDGAATNLSN